MAGGAESTEGRPSAAQAGVQPSEVRIDTGIGYKVERLEGDVYEARFVGTAWNTADQDDGAFLSDVPYDEHHQGGYLEREQFGIDQLFPPEWQEAEVEYEIVVRARRVQGGEPLLGERDPEAESAFDRFQRKVEAEADADPTGQERAILDHFRRYYTEQNERLLARRRQQGENSEDTSGQPSAEEVWSRLGSKPGFNEAVGQAITDIDEGRGVVRPEIATEAPPEK